MAALLKSFTTEDTEDTELFGVGEKCFASSVSSVVELWLAVDACL